MDKSDALGEEIERAITANGLSDDALAQVLRAIGAAARSFAEDAARVEGAVESLPTAVREAAGSGARGLTPKGEDELIQRLSERTAYEAQRAVTRMGGMFKLRSFVWGMIACVAALAAGGGGTLFAVGWTDRQRARGLEGAAFMAQIAEVNDTNALREACMANPTQKAGTSWVKCQLPPVWVQASPGRTAANKN